MKLKLDLPCPRCGGELTMMEDRYKVKVACSGCGIVIAWSKKHLRRVMLRYRGGELVLDWNWLIDNAYLRIMSYGLEF